LPQALTSRPKKPPQPSPQEQTLMFDRMYDAIVEEEAGFVGELEKFLKSHEQSKQNKSRALYDSWEGEVFDNVKSQIAKKVDARSARSVSNRGAALMQEYLHVSNSKSFGMFRDIIIESEYDPMKCHGHFIKYDPRLSRDPCKLEVRKYAESKADEVPPQEFQRADRMGAVPRLDSAMWDKLEATPYGRLGKVIPRADAEPYGLHNRVTNDHFDIKHGREVLLKELPLGKRCDPQLIGPAGSRQMAAVMGNV
jgi:hypothetical protein